MKSLNTIMKESFREYLIGLNVKIKSTVKLSELIEITRKKNSSDPYRAVGMITKNAIDQFEGQKK